MFQIKHSPLILASRTVAKHLKVLRCVFIVPLLAAVVSAEPVPSVPPQYQSLYTSMQAKLTAFTQQIQQHWSGSTGPVVNSAQLREASSDAGGLLLMPGRESAVKTEMVELQALGVDAVTIHVDFPTLSPSYYANPSELQKYETFYSQVAADIRAAGLKLIVETQLVKFDAIPLNYAKGLSWADYQTGRAQTAVTVAQVMKPDYMVVILEPDTEQSYSGQTPVGTIPGSTHMLQTILNALQQAGLSHVPIGAGTGTWQDSFSSWMAAFAAMPVQFLDLHVYPINMNYLQNALTGADIAHKANKQITMSEAWLQKVADSELSGEVADTNSRNPYEYWAPLDQQFLDAMVMLSQYKQFSFVSPFWSSYLFAYIPETPTSTQQDAFDAAETANGLGLFTSTGVQFESAILKHPDAKAPQVPSKPAVSLGASEVHLSWKSSYDNVGTAGYSVFRDGKIVGTTSSTEFDDTGSRGTNSAYTLSAFDASGNVSADSGAGKISRR